MIKIEIKNTTKTRREITRKSDNKVMVFYEQQAWAHTYNQSGELNAYPSEIIISLEADQQPLAVGIYMLAPESIFVDKFKHLAIGRNKLKPLVSGSGVSANKAA